MSSSKSSSVDVERPKEDAVEQQTTEKTISPEVIDCEDGEIVKNSKAVSSWTIFASALANFSDGYQNNLVSDSLTLGPA